MEAVKTMRARYRKRIREVRSRHLQVLFSEEFFVRGLDERKSERGD